MLKKLELKNVRLLTLGDNIYFLNGIIQLSFKETGDYLEILTESDLTSSDLYALKLLVRGIFKTYNHKVIYTTCSFFRRLGFRKKNNYYYTKNPFTNNILEICCGSYEDAIMADHALCDRIELNSALFLGGLTPSVASSKLVLRNTDLEVATMTRPRPAGFCYTKFELIQLFEEAESLLKAGVHGIVFGFLNEDKTINEEETIRMINLCNQYGALSIFSRAIDVSADYEVAFDTLVRLGIDRILTSGAKASIVDSFERVKALKLKYGRSVEIVVGSGINENTISSLINNDLKVFHASCKMFRRDKTTSNNDVDFSYNKTNYYEATNFNEVMKVSELLLEEVKL